MSFLGALYDIVIAATSCCIPNPNISINGRAYRIIKLLGEGGFSFVYLAEDGSGNLYALKKVRCTLGSEEAARAQREVDIYRLFDHKNIIQVLDSSTITEADGSKTIYIFLPYFMRGNLQDAINRNNLNKTQFSEREIMVLFRQICDAVEAMHIFKPSSAARTRYGPDFRARTDEENRQDRALLSDQSHQESSTLETPNNGEITPWAHRDIKPGNILISDDGETPVLMDFGSACPARVVIHNRRDALAEQDLASEHCSMPYRAPELFDVKTETTLDEKVDIWSLGCTLYAMAYGESPFEANLNDQGGSIALAVLNGQFRFPSDDSYSSGFKDLIRWMLTTEPKDRPDIKEVISRVDEHLHQDASQ